MCIFCQPACHLVQRYWSTDVKSAVPPCRLGWHEPSTPRHSVKMMKEIARLADFTKSCRTLHYTAHATCDSKFQHHFEASICDGFGPEPQENTHAWILSDVFEESFQISIDLCNPLLLHRILVKFSSLWSMDHMLLSNQSTTQGLFKLLQPCAAPLGHADCRTVGSGDTLPFFVFIHAFTNVLFIF